MTGIGNHQETLLKKNTHSLVLKRPPRYPERFPLLPLYRLPIRPLREAYCITRGFCERHRHQGISRIICEGVLREPLA